MNHLVYENKDCLRWFAGFLADGIGDALADIFLLFFCECAGNSDADVWHDVLLRGWILIIDRSLNRRTINPFLAQSKEYFLAADYPGVQA